jgi:pilus assembly protein Flp/PilA
MKNLMLKAYVNMQTLMACEEGQDLVEYALLLGLVALACVAILSQIGLAINTIFTDINTSLSTA